MRLHPPGIEPEAPAWKADMLPLHHRRFKTNNKNLVFVLYKLTPLRGIEPRPRV